MPLEDYQKKRDFGKTPEPSGASASGASASGARSRGSRSREEAPRSRSFVIQKHDASRLHYDFRLEFEGVLLSWAVPKGPSLDPHDKRLAMHVEDHPLDYASFEGVIPKGEYGAGSVIVWDRGWWEPLASDVAAALAKGDFKFALHGEKLQGNWVLVRMKPRPNERGESWLLIKERDEYARTAAEFDVLAERPESVSSGRTIEQVAEEGDPPAGAPPIGTDQLPADAPLQLATLVGAAPEGPEWIHEIKYDGYRVKAVLENGRARLQTRNGLDRTADFRPIANNIEGLPISSAILDGEVVAFDSAGISDFSALQEAISGKRADRLAYVVFDLLYLDGHDLRQAPLLQRKELLRTLLDTAPSASAPTGGALRYADHFAEQGDAFQREACARGLEGSVSKRADRPWVGGRTRDWLKVKCHREQEFVVGGFTEPGGSRKGFGALLLGVYSTNGELRYAGRVGTGFTEQTLHDLRALLDELGANESPFSNPPRLAGKVHWVRPELVVEVAFAEWTREGHLRQPSFKGVREDKAPGEVTFEVAERAEEAATPPTRTREPFGKPILLGGAKITNPEKLLFEDSPLSKIGLARYYEQVAPCMLPHIANRPLTLVRCPIGRGKGCFYQKHPDLRGMNAAIKTVSLDERDGPAPYMWIDDVAGLLALAQLGVLEIHTWGSQTDKPYHPDRLIFDLDPGPGVEWPRVVETAFLVRERLETLGFAPFVKTTGGKGLHVQIPVEPVLAFDEARTWTKSFVDALVAEDPASLTAKMAKQARHGKVFVDYVRNAQGATAVAPYSTRARPSAPVAVPVEWDELREGINPASFTAERVLARLEKLGADPWASMGGAAASEKTLRAALERT